MLASSDYFATGDQVMLAPVPTQGTQTIYALVGDLFAQLCIAGLLVLMGFALVRSHRQRASGDAGMEEMTPMPEPSLVG